MNNVKAAIHVVEGLLIELAAEGLNFRLTSVPHAEESFTKPVTTVRLADGTWDTKSVELIVEALQRRSELETFTLRTTSDAWTTPSGKTAAGKLIGITKLNLTAGPAVIEQLGQLSTRESMIPFTRTASLRAQELANSDHAAA